MRFNSLPLLLACLTLSAPLSIAQAAEETPAKGVVVQNDTVYGQVHGAALLADIAMPAAGEKRPAIISVHGGRWVGGNKRDPSSIKVEQWAEFGFVAMSIDYRLKACTQPPACQQDLQCAIRFIHANAEKYKVDPEKVFLIGQSAGGQMVTLAGQFGDGPYPRTGGWDKASNKVRGVISVAAPYDLTTLDWGALWTPPGVDAMEARAVASPIKHVAELKVPLLIIHSDDDKSVPIGNVLPMVDALKQAGAKHTFHRYKDAGHMQITPEVIARTREFMDAVLSASAEK